RLPPPPTLPFPYTTLFRSTRRHVGRAALHGDRLSASLLPPLPPLPALFPPDGARPVPGAARRARRLMTVGIERLAVYVPAYALPDRKSTRLNSSHDQISYA